MGRIAIETSNIYKYPSKDSHFRPSIRHPEYPDNWEISTEEQNGVYECVRNAFIRMGLDYEHGETKEWNPLKEYVSHGDHVLIKPNFVHHNNSAGTVECLYTQPSVIAAVLDYVCIALDGTGEIIVGDAPMQDCDFEKLIEQSGLDCMIDYYRNKGINVKLADFRGVITKNVNGVIHYTEKENVGKIIDLGPESEFSRLTKEENERLRKGANDPADLHAHHNIYKHEYEICNEALWADVIIDMPKPKCHMKAGVTISLKNMVGINVRKEFLPHHMEGDKQSHTGDAYQQRSLLKQMRARARDLAYIRAKEKKYIRAYLYTSLRRGCAFIINCFSKDKLTQGTWAGNETISKTICDLNKIIMYADKSGKITDTVQRKRLIVADMIVSGELKGPLSPSPKNVGIIAVGDDPLCFDECIATIMGAKISNISTLTTARNLISGMSLSTPDSVGIIYSNNVLWDGKTCDEINPESTLHFHPIPSWESAFYE